MARAWKHHSRGLETPCQISSPSDSMINALKLLFNDWVQRPAVQYYLWFNVSAACLIRTRCHSRAGAWKHHAKSPPPLSLTLSSWLWCYTGLETPTPIPGQIPAPHPPPPPPPSLTLGSLWCVLNDQVPPPLHIPHVLHLQNSTILNCVRFQSIKKMLDSSRVCLTLYPL